MGRSIALGVIAALLAVPAALAAGDRGARGVALARAVDKTAHATSMRYVMDMHVLDESPAARTHTRTGVVRGTVAYDDRIVRGALTAMTGGIEFRSLHFEARIGVDGFVHLIKMTGRTANGGRSLSVSARLYAFGKPVHLKPPAAATFMDQQSDMLAD